VKKGIPEGIQNRAQRAEAKEENPKGFISNNNQ